MDSGWWNSGQILCTGE